MSTAQFNKLLRQHGGWVDGEFLRFPTPHLLAMFQRAVDAITKTDGRA